jgi:hypothetical protein
MAGDIELVQALVPEGEPILALIWSPHWYLQTGRPPALGQYYYLPWQAAYAREPVLDRRLDLCRDLAVAPPKVLVWDQAPLWDKYALVDFEPCVIEHMQRDYMAVSGTPLLIRKPVSDADRALLSARGARLEALSVR